MRNLPLLRKAFDVLEQVNGLVRRTRFLTRVRVQSVPGVGRVPQGYERSAMTPCGCGIAQVEAQGARGVRRDVEMKGFETEGGVRAARKTSVNPRAVLPYWDVLSRYVQEGGRHG